MMNLGKLLNRNTIVLSLSLFMAAMGVFGARSFLLERADFYKRKYQRNETVQRVVVPNRALRPGDILNPTLLSVREIPSKYADSNALTQNTYTSAIGKTIQADVDQGKPLLWAHLQPDEPSAAEFSLASRVSNGNRALTVRVDDVNSLSGFLQPGNSIDLLLSYRLQQKMITRPVVERLQVIATGNETQVVMADDQPSFSTITVEVTPDQASRITLAQQLGSLTAMLRHPDDNAALGAKALTLEELSNGGRRNPRSSSKKGRDSTSKSSIEFIVGGV